MDFFRSAPLGTPINVDEQGPGTVPARVSELVNRRSPFAQAEFVFNYTPEMSPFTIRHSLRQSSEDRLDFLLISPNGDVAVWIDPTDRQDPGSLTLRCSPTGTRINLLLFIPRP